MKLPPEDPEARAQRRILVVDDDQEVREILSTALEKEDFEVWAVGSAEEALRLLERNGLAHLAIVDIRLPGMDGSALCRKILEYSDIPIVMLTVVTEEKTVVDTIERYAEDYIRKPFNPDELVARVHRLMRRIGDFSYALQPVIKVDEHLSVDFVHHKAMVNDRPVSLTPTETKLLHILMREAGQTVHTPFILGRLWPHDKADANTLRVHVHRLRQKIEVTPSRPRYVVTERGTGYSFLATH